MLQALSSSINCKTYLDPGLYRLVLIDLNVKSLRRTTSEKDTNFQVVFFLIKGPEAKYLLENSKKSTTEVVENGDLVRQWRRSVGYWGGRETGCRPPGQDSTISFFLRRIYLIFWGLNNPPLLSPSVDLPNILGDLPSLSSFPIKGST